jgi:hypothetical protein
MNEMHFRSTVHARSLQNHSLKGRGVAEKMLAHVVERVWLMNDKPRTGKEIKS